MKKALETTNPPTRFPKIAGVTACAVLAGSAVAQTPPNSEEKTSELAEVVVTGTSIRGIAPVGAPIIGLSQADIQLMPNATTTDVLRQVPAVIATGASENYGGSANNSNANITGGNGVNLRGLGTEATLTLLNGRRLPPAGVQGQYFDPSVFATSAIARMEVMPDGGSAIYGADAVGGVVNVITRKHFDGAEAYLKKGFNNAIGSVQAGGLIGKTWDRGNAMLAYEYFDREALAVADRPLYTDNLSAFGGADLRLFTANPGNIQIGQTRYPIPASQNGVSLSPTSLLPASASNPANRESVYKGASAIPGQTRHSMLANVSQDLNSRVTVWAEGFYAHRDLEQSIGAQTANLSVPAINPFFVAPAGVTPPLCAASVGAPAGTRCETVNYSFFKDFGPRKRDAFQEIYQGAVGVDAQLAGSWRASGYASYGRDVEERTQYGVNNPQLLIALGDTNAATAFNPFADGSATNPATLAKILGSGLVATKSGLFDVGAKVDGSIFELGGGEAKLAAGAELQKHEFTYHTRDNFATANNAVFTDVLAKPDRTVKSAYTEIFVPLISRLNAHKGAQELSFSAALRHDDYSDFGSTTNPKFALQYTPFDGITFRGTFGKSFRAPTLSDMNPAILVVTVEDFVDPKSPTGLTRTMFLRGGNTSLGPEHATTKSIGVDLKPVWISGLTASLTYFDVSYTDRIEAPGNDRTALTAAKEPLLGSLITRNPSATLVSYYLSLPQFTGVQEPATNIKALVDGRKVNVGRLNTNGLDGSIQYSTEVGIGTLNAGAVGSYVFNFKRAILPTLPLINVVDTFGNPQKLRARGNLGLTSGRYSAVAYANFSGSYTNDTVTPNVEVASYTTFDLGLRSTLNTGSLGMKSLVLSLDVQNLFDKAPPIVVNATPLPFDPQVASVLGRYFTVGVRASW